MKRIHSWDAWSEAPFYTVEERAALTEAITIIVDQHVPDELYRDARTFFNEK